MAKFQVGNVVKYKSLDKKFNSVVNDGDLMVIRITPIKHKGSYYYVVYHTETTSSLYHEDTLTKIEMKWKDLHVSNDLDYVESGEWHRPQIRCLRKFQYNALSRILK